MSDKSVKHSREPWVIDERDGRPYAINSAAREKVIVWGGIASRATTGVDNARRIVAAVNAVAGIPTGALEDGDIAHALGLLKEYVERGDGPGDLRYEARETLRALGRI